MHYIHFCIVIIHRHDGTTYDLPNSTFYRLMRGSHRTLICDGCSMRTGGRFLLRTPGPILFGTCISSTCLDQSFFRTYIFFGLFTSNIPRYFLDFTLLIYIFITCILLVLFMTLFYQINIYLLFISPILMFDVDLRLRFVKLWSLHDLSIVACQLVSCLCLANYLSFKCLCFYTAFAASLKVGLVNPLVTSRNDHFHVNWPKSSLSVLFNLFVTCSICFTLSKVEYEVEFEYMEI